jgi:ribonucleoside-triphosphate reductase
MNKYFNLIGSGSVKIGSLGVVTQNLPRYAYMSNGDLQTFKVMLEDNIILGQRINDIKRGILKKAIDKKMIPLYNLDYVNISTQYSTIGINGLYEALEILGYDITTKEGKEIAEELIDYANMINDRLSDDLRAPHNMEQIPAENVAIKLCKKDTLLGYNTRYELYSNQFVPLSHEATLLERIELQGSLDAKFGGGSILHCNINEDINDEEVFIKITKSMFEKGVVYFAFNKIVVTCNDCLHTSTTSKDTYDKGEVTCPNCGSTNVECALRVVGFIRKIKSWAKERRQEANNRIFYKEIDEKVAV